MDTRGAAGIEDAEGAAEQLPNGKERLGPLLQAREATRVALRKLRGRIDASTIPDGCAFVMFGSWGRHELTSASDVDWALLVDDPDLDLEGPTVAGVVEHIRHLVGDETPPGRQGYFGGAFKGGSLDQRIGLDEDDTRNLTRRMLLLLESVAVVGESVQHEVQERVLQRYLEHHRRDYTPPRFLLNDVIRYWRTICVDFEGKAAQDRREGVAADKFVMRNAKLRTSRKMLYASGLLPVLLCQHLAAEDMRGYLMGQFRAVATDRVSRAFLHLGQADAGVRTLGAYSDWLHLLDDEASRAELAGLEKSSRREDPVFNRVRRIGETLDKGLTGLLFESPLSQVARTYVAL